MIEILPVWYRLFTCGSCKNSFFFVEESEIAICPECGSKKVAKLGFFNRKVEKTEEKKRKTEETDQS